MNEREETRSVREAGIGDGQERRKQRRKQVAFDDVFQPSHALHALLTLAKLI